VRPSKYVAFFKIMSGSGVFKIMLLFSRRRAGCRGGTAGGAGTLMCVWV
jgi:hypothetical protein